MTLANRLTDVRKALGLSQEEMAAKIGVAYRTYQNYEQGITDPKALVFAFMVKNGVNVDWLITGDGQMMRDATPAPAVSSAPLDLPLLSMIIGMVDEWLDCHNRSLAPAKKAEVVATLYEIAAEEGAKTGEAGIEPRTVERFLRLVA